MSPLWPTQLTPIERSRRNRYLQQGEQRTIESSELIMMQKKKNTEVRNHEMT